MKSLVSAALLLLLTATTTTAPPTGRWVTESGNLEIEIAPCEQKLCGKVVQVLANRSMSDPSAEIATPPALGMEILKGFADAGDGEWEGEIFNRENGKTYSCVLRLVDADRLEVRPYVGIHLIGKTQIWRRPAAKS